MNSQDQLALALRGFAYQAISQIGERLPSVIQEDLQLPERLFHALATEAPGVRASLQQSLATLSIAYQGLRGKFISFHSAPDLHLLLLVQHANDASSCYPYLQIEIKEHLQVMKLDKSPSLRLHEVSQLSLIS